MNEFGMVVAMSVVLVTANCDAKKEASGTPDAPSSAASETTKLPESSVFETTTPDKFKTKVSFRAPKDTQSEEGQRFTWKTMVIDVFATFTPAESNEHLVGAAAQSLLAGAEVTDANDGQRLISRWKHSDGAGGVLCAVKGKKPMLIVSYEPGFDGTVALAVCQSLEVGP